MDLAIFKSRNSHISCNLPIYPTYSALKKADFVTLINFKAFERDKNCPALDKLKGVKLAFFSAEYVGRYVHSIKYVNPLTQIMLDLWYYALL